jgi:hypothetical protein
MCSVYEDVELLDWLRWADEHGSGFLRAIAEASMSADLPHYLLLRPVLLELKREWPKPARDSMCGRHRLSRRLFAGRNLGDLHEMG